MLASATTTSRPPISVRVADSMSVLRMETCCAVSSRVMRSVITLRSMPWGSSHAAAVRSCSVVEEKVNEPVSS